MTKPVLTVAVEEEGSVSVAVLCGPVDSATIEQLRETLDPICLPPGRRVLLDCRRLTYLNSRAIGLIMKYHRGLMLTRGRLVLSGLNERLVRTLDLLQLGKSLVVFPTREEAMNALQ
ncbi:MAG: STAS domain-containing protein [Kiritimatiellae bacterium]|nr:STAS domain-containing protein [Kiritimatiellia bacterium]MCO5044388.1 STAS domain-containing protein [Kiritimatiellia bacterium]MCO5060457.1 STAS domain-containing protein [Kiritimatiellia bacterium]MCO5068057.1 STAS domain-containing protein [Kiritimatiellia bacterium]MCO6400654.1 STAS domain-containing protein [Verrucomicrobiota bacterium]